MPGWVEQDSHVVLRLEVGDPRAKGDRIGDSNVQILYVEVKVHHRPLFTTLWGPHRGYVSVG